MRGDPPERPGNEAVDPAGVVALHEGVGIEEVEVVPWPLMVHRRARARVEASRRYPWLVLVVTLTGLFAVAFTITLLMLTLPTIAEDFGTTTSVVSWVITGPTLAFGVVGPFAGRAGDLFGHHRLYLIGLGFAGVFAALTAVAWSPAALIAFRVLGAGLGAATGPAAMAIINQVFTPEQRVRALGYWSMVGAGAPVLGAFAGVPLVEAFGWRTVFAVQAPACALGFVVALAFLPRTGRTGTARFDLAGAALLAVGATALLVALNRGPVVGWAHPVVVASVLLGPVCLVAFWAVETRTSDPLLDLRYVRRRAFAVPIANQTLLNMAYMGGFFITPLMLHDAFGFTAGHVLLLTIWRPFAFAVTGPLAAGVTVRFGGRTAALAGSLCLAVSMVMLAAVRPGLVGPLVVLGVVLSGVALGISSPAMAASVANAVEETDFGIAGATLQLCNQFGIAVGIQLMQTVQELSAGSSAGVTSYSHAYLVGLAASLAGGAVALALRRPALAVSQP